MTEAKEGPPKFQLRLVMPSDPRFLPVVRATIGKLASVLESSDEESRATVLAIDEALANVIRYAYHSEHDKPIKFICEVRTLQLDFRIIDQGTPPEMGQVCARDPAAMEPGGKGTHVIKEVVDVVRYERKGINSGSERYLPRFLHSATPALVNVPSLPGAGFGGRLRLPSRLKKFADQSTVNEHTYGPMRRRASNDPGQKSEIACL